MIDDLTVVFPIIISSHIPSKVIEAGGRVSEERQLAFEDSLCLSCDGLEEAAVRILGGPQVLAILDSVGLGLPGASSDC